MVQKNTVGIEQLKQASVTWEKLTKDVQERISPPGGAVTGPISSTDRAIAIWDGTGGDTLRDSSITINSSGQLGGTIADPTAGDQVGDRDYNDSRYALSGHSHSYNIFSTIAVSGQSNVVADSTSDTLTLVAGTNITITTDAATDSITINSSGGGGSALEVQLNSVAVDSAVEVLSFPAGWDITEPVDHTINIGMPTFQAITDSGNSTTNDITIGGMLDIGNIQIDGNEVRTTNTNGDLVINLNGTGGLDFVGSGAASRFYIDSLGKIALNGGIPGSELFYASNEDAGITRASMTFASANSSQFAIYELRDITTGNNWKMAFSNSTGHLRFTYNDTIKGYLSNEGKLRLTNSSTAVAQARIHLQEDTPEAEIMRLETSGLTGLALIDRTHGNGLDTTTATVTTIGTIDASTASRNYKIEFDVTARVTVGTNINEVAAYQKAGLFKNVGGTVTQIGATETIFEREDTNIGAYNVDFTISGTNILIQVTGEASHTVRWRGYYTFRIT